MDDASATTDPGIKAYPVNMANPDEANPVSEANQVNEANQAAKETTADTPMKGKEQEAALLLNLSKTPPLTKASFTTEDWSEENIGC